MIKKAALTLCVIGVSGAYVWNQSGTSSGSDLAEASPASATVDPAAVAAAVAEPPLIVREPANSDSQAATALSPASRPVKVQSISVDSNESDVAAATESEPSFSDDGGSEEGQAPIRMPLPHVAPQSNVAPRPTKVSATVSSKSSRRLSDGTFDGPAIDAFYGLVQVEVTVQSGHLANVKVLRFPSDRRVSIAINRQALPILKIEAIAAQSANVDIVSGATLTSEAFIESLGGALKQASA